MKYKTKAIYAAINPVKIDLCCIGLRIQRRLPTLSILLKIEFRNFFPYFFPYFSFSILFFSLLIFYILLLKLILLKIAYRTFIYLSYLFENLREVFGIRDLGSRSGESPLCSALYFAIKIKKKLKNTIKYVFYSAYFVFIY